MSPRAVPAPRPSQARGDVDAPARLRGAAIHDAEVRKRRKLAAELVAALRAPLIPGSAPSDLERIAYLAEPRRAR